MKRIFILLLIIFFTSSSISLAQSVSPVSTSSARNKLILLEAPLNGEVHFNRFKTRTNVVLVRLNKLHSRILTRIAKLKIDANSLKKINLQINSIKTDLSDLEKTLNALDQDWQNIKTTKNKADYLSLKKNLDQTLLKIEEILKNQKLILKDLKKYKLIISPTQSLAEPDRN